MAAAAAGATYDAPVPFPIYHPGAAAAYYAHASMAELGKIVGVWSEFSAAVQGVPYPTAEATAAAAAAAAEGKGKGKSRGTSPEKGSSGAPSGEDASRRGDSGSDESSDTRDDDTDHKDSSAPKKRKSGNTSAEESPFPVKGRSASKLPVSAPGRAALPNATPNLNIGMDLWSASPALAVPAVQGEANPGLALARHDSVAQLDERKLKRERRKQSNRESARRSRLRKQAFLPPCAMTDDDKKKGLLSDNDTKKDETPGDEDSKAMGWSDYLAPVATHGHCTSSEPLISHFPGKEEEGGRTIWVQIRSLSIYPRNSNIIPTLHTCAHFPPKNSRMR